MYLISNPMSAQNTINNFSLDEKKGELNIDIDDVIVFKNSDSIKQVFNRFEK